MLSPDEAGSTEPIISPESQERFMSLPIGEKDRLISQVHTEANTEALEKRKKELMQLLENILGKVPNSEEQKAENIKIEETNNYTFISSLELI